MVDTLCSDSEKTPIKTSKTSGIEISESAVSHIQKGRAKPKRRDEADNQLSSLNQSLLALEIGAMDCSKGDSFSVSDSLNSKDTSSSSKKKRRDKKNRRKDRDLRATGLLEGQQRAEVEREGASAISLEPRLMESSSLIDDSLAKARKALDKHTAMERAEVSPSYTSDEWDVASSDSDTDGDHTDSSDDDDPKSQVDRLIERGTLMYVDAENSALSSEDESDSDYEYDSESDITDVSPLVSATASPVGLSPVLPRRVPTSPLALHDNRDLNFSSYDPHQSPFDWSNPGDQSTNNIYTDNRPDSTNMDLLLQAVIELENKNNAEKYNLNQRNTHQTASQGLPDSQNDQVFIHPIRDNPHHSHLRKNYSRRKNMSFSNEEVRKIDRDNKILLKKIMAAHSRPKTCLAGAHHHHHSPPNRSSQKPSHSAINRKKGEDKIRKENLILLKKIQEAKPSKDLAADRRVPSMASVESLLSSISVSNRSLRSPSSSCGAFMRSLIQPSHAAVPPPRKETAL